MADKTGTADAAGMADRQLADAIGLVFESYDRTRDLADRVANVLADAADTLGLMHVKAIGDRVYAYHVWTGEGVNAERDLAFIVSID